MKNDDVAEPDRVDCSIDQDAVARIVARFRAAGPDLRWFLEETAKRYSGESLDLHHSDGLE